MPLNFEPPGCQARAGFLGRSKAQGPDAGGDGHRAWLSNGRSVGDQPNQRLALLLER